MSRINLRDLLKRMAGPSRTEATLQSEIHTLLLAADLNLEEAELDDVTLESQTAGRRRGRSRVHRGEEEPRPGHGPR